LFSCSSDTEEQAASEVRQADTPSKEMQIISSSAVKKIDRPGIFGTKGYVVKLVETENRLGDIILKLPSLPKRRTSIGCYLQVPENRSDELKSSEGFITFNLVGGGERMGAKVLISDLTVTSDVHVPGDLMYTRRWIESLDGDLSWQPEYVEIELDCEDVTTRFPMAFYIICGGGK
jgi:hypothetical protein